MKVQFLGLIANADSSILKLNLDHGFKIESLEENEGKSLIASLEGVDIFEATKKLYGDYSSLNTTEKKIFFVSNSFECDTETKHQAASDFDNRLLNNYLLNTFRLIRLFKEGNVCIPYHYYFHQDQTPAKSFMHVGTILLVPREPFSLKDSEISYLQDFLKNSKLPFKEPYLQLAFENFELSYQILHPNLSFLALMISLEVMFNPSDIEIRNRIARNAAVLLGKDVNESESIFAEIKKLYDKRSVLVHTGKLDITQNDVSALRRYIRESIKQINGLGKDKNSLLKTLNTLGFGQRSSLEQSSPST